MDWLKYLASRAAGALDNRSSDGAAQLTRIEVDRRALLAPSLDSLLSALALLCQRYGREEEVSFLIRVQEPSGVSSWRARAALGDSYSRSSIASALRREPSEIGATSTIWLFVNFDATKISEEAARAGVRAGEDLVLTVGSAADGSMQVGALCDARRYRRAAVVDVLENLLEMLHQLERIPAEQPLQSIEFLSTTQLARLAEWSSGGQDGEPFIGLPARFRKIVEQYGDALAVRTRSERWSYRELERRAELVAAALRRRGVGRGSRVIVSQKREAALLASLLGVLKTAATYVAIEPGYPVERVAFIAEDTGAELILTDTNAAFPPGIPVLNVADTRGSEAPHIEFADTPVTAEDTAYILYTSGSTGQPKGVMIGHDSLDHFLRWSIAAHNLGPADVTAALTSVLFDVSVCDLWTPLVSGAALALLATPAELLELSDVPLVAMMCAVPSAFQTEFGLKRALNPEARGPKIGILNLAGEALDPTLASLITSRLPSSLRNCYGPTEATVYATWAEVKDPSDISIGRPLPNMRAFVLDGSGNRAPPGMPGELCLAGLGVARGYLNRDELNAERFVSAHFDDKPRLYRTGDLVRYRDDGALLFLGRADHQIKLNGYRIELGEVESAILRRTSVPQCAVLPLTLGRRGTVLVGCIQAGCGETPAGIVRKLAPLLPEYMIPTQWLEVESFPVTVSGKLDRVALQRTVAACFMPQSRHQPTDGVQT